MIRRISMASLLLFATLLACAIHIGPTPPPSPCPIANLLVDETLFPEEFFQTEPPSKDAAPIRFGINKIGVGFTTMNKGGAIQQVYEGGSLQDTQKEYQEEISLLFSPRKGWTDWYIPSAFNYQSTVADQFRFGCYTHVASGVESCQAVGQYGVFLIRFHTDMSPVMTYRNLEHILQVIDRKAAKCLGR